MSREHKDWTLEERKEHARQTHARNRLRKITGIINTMEEKVKLLKIERKGLREVVKTNG